MNKMLVGLGLSFIAKMMDGHKTYFGGAVLILLGLGKILVGIAGIVGNMYPDIGAPVMDVDTISATFQNGAAMFGAGLAAIGIGHKVEKS